MEVNDLYLSDFHLPFCTGCHNCIFIMEDKCPHDRIVKDVKDRILGSESVILATPGYMFSVQGKMENLLDHVAYNLHRPKYFKKPIFLLSGCSRWQRKGVFIPMEWSLFNMNYVQCYLASLYRLKGAAFQIAVGVEAERAGPHPCERSLAAGRTY